MFEMFTVYFVFWTVKVKENFMIFCTLYPTLQSLHHLCYTVNIAELVCLMPLPLRLKHVSISPW